MSLYLSRADVARKTCRKQKRRQIEQLLRMGVQFELDGEGWPLVKTNAPSTTNHAEQMMIEAMRRAS